MWPSGEGGKLPIDHIVMGSSLQSSIANSPDSRDLHVNINGVMNRPIFENNFELDQTLRLTKYHKIKTQPKFVIAACKIPFIYDIKGDQ